MRLSATLLAGTAAILCAASWQAKADEPAANAASTGAADPALIAHGKYLTDAGDCAACHTAKDGKQFAGGLMMNTPFGPISTPNITPDKETGIGNYTDDQFYRLFHNGINAKGERIYPVMPFPWYTKVTRDDTLAIKAYLFSLAPVHAPRKPSGLIFPFNVRAALIGWDAVFLKTGEFKPDPSKSAQVNRGAYLVQGLEHCGECHNGRNLLGDTQVADALAGGPIDKWYAPNITSDKTQGIGRFTDEQIFTYLKTGTEKEMGVVVGPMSQTSHESLRKLTDDDLHAIVAYLKSTPPKKSYTPTHNVLTASETPPGAETYLNYCASCHLQNGKGVEGSVPNLAGNPTVTARGPETILRVIVGGVQAQGSYSPMPAIGVRMTDQEVADATNYIRKAWGNDAPAVAGPGEVAAIRKETKTLMALNADGGCPKVVEPATARAIADPANKVPETLADLNEANMLDHAQTLITKVKAAAPQAKQADIINSLMIAYCPVITANTTLTQSQKVDQFDEWGERLYTQIVSKGQI